MAIVYNAFKALSSLDLLACYKVTTQGISNILASDISPSTTTIPLVDASAFPTSGKVRIDSEIIAYSSKSGNNLIAYTRDGGYRHDWSLPASHIATTSVDLVTGTFTTIAGDSTAFDYFNDAIEVGDAFWIGKAGARFDDIKFYVGTPLVATSVSFGWRYDRNGKAAELSVTNDDALTKSGEQIVTFIPPTDWHFQYGWAGYTPSYKPKPSDKTWVWVVIIAVNAPTEGGEQSTQAVQVGNNTIVVTGGSAATRLTGSDVVMDVADSNIMTETISGASRDSHHYFFVNASLQFGDGSTGCYFDLRKDTYLFATNATIKTASDGNLYGGDKFTNLDASLTGPVILLGWSMCNAILLDFSVGTIELYKPLIKYRLIDPGWANGAIVNYGSGKYYGLTHEGGIPVVYGAEVLIYLSKPTFKYCRFSGQTSILWPTSVFAFSDSDIWVTGGQYGFIRSSVGMTLSNIDASAVFPTVGEIIGVQIHLRNGINFYLRDCQGFRYKPNIYHPKGGATSYLYRQFGLSLKIIDSNGNGISGVSVVIKDVNGAQVASVTTDDNGDIATQYLTHTKSYDNSPDYFWGIANIVEYYTPHTVTISKAGYKTRTIQYTMDRKREEIEMIEPDVPVAPSGLTATAASRTSINLSWADNSDNETGFRIERSPNGTTHWTHIATTDANVTAHLDGDLQCGTTYYYRVCAVNDVGLSDYSNVAGTATEACPVPAVVMELESMIP